MNNTIVVNHSISPSTQYPINRKTSNDSHRASFRDAPETSVHSSEGEVNISSSATSKFNTSSILIIPTPEKLNELMSSFVQSVNSIFNQNGIIKAPLWSLVMIRPGLLLRQAMPWSRGEL